LSFESARWPAGVRFTGMQEIDLPRFAAFEPLALLLDRLRMRLVEPEQLPLRVRIEPGDHPLHSIVSASSRAMPIRCATTAAQSVRTGARLTSIRTAAGGVETECLAGGHPPSRQMPRPPVAHRRVGGTAE
jgi:hypothetical protein